MFLILLCTCQLKKRLHFDFICLKIIDVKWVCFSVIKAHSDESTSCNSAVHLTVHCSSKPKKLLPFWLYSTVQRQTTVATVTVVRRARRNVLPANTRHSLKLYHMSLIHCLRRWPNNDSPPGQCLLCLCDKSLLSLPACRASRNGLCNPFTTSMWILCIINIRIYSLKRDDVVGKLAMHQGTRRGYYQEVFCYSIR